MIRSERGWTYLEFVIAFMVFSLLLGLIYPLLIVFMTSNVEKEMHLQALWLGQEAVERQLAISPSSQTMHRQDQMTLDDREYAISITREAEEQGLDRVEVNVTWEIGNKARELTLERYIFVR